eukprot:583324-Prymnesium_polylepis.1
MSSAERSASSPQPHAPHGDGAPPAARSSGRSDDPPCCPWASGGTSGGGPAASTSGCACSSARSSAALRSRPLARVSGVSTWVEMAPTAPCEKSTAPRLQHEDRSSGVGGSVGGAWLG